LPLVELPEQCLGEERQELDERDAGVALVDVRPLRPVDCDSANELGEELRVAALVHRRQ
jgi:hypothetical protein